MRIHKINDNGSRLFGLLDHVIGPTAVLNEFYLGMGAQGGKSFDCRTFTITMGRVFAMPDRSPVVGLVSSMIVGHSKRLWPKNEII